MTRTLHMDITAATENAQERANLNGAPVGIWRGPITRLFIVDEDPESDLDESGFEIWAAVEPEAPTTTQTSEVLRVFDASQSEAVSAFCSGVRADYEHRGAPWSAVWVEREGPYRIVWGVRSGDEAAS